MNSAEAKAILMAYRPGGEDEHDPEVAEALACAGRDPALQRWLDEQLAAQRTIRDTLRHIPVPSELREQILVRHQSVLVPVWWHRKVWLQIAAGFVVLLGLAGLWFMRGSEGTFQTFRDRMARKVLREYSMDIVTSDAAKIRQFLATNGAPADYLLPPALDRMPMLGAGLQSWQGERVSMVCLDGGTQGTLFLFVVDSADVKRPPGNSPEFAAVSNLMTASWTGGGKTYVLAGTAGLEALRRNF